MGYSEIRKILNSSKAKKYFDKTIKVDNEITYVAMSMGSLLELIKRITSGKLRVEVEDEGGEEEEILLEKKFNEMEI